MSQYTEFEGKNIEKALESASKSLNLPVDKIHYDILSYGSSGIFGLVGVKKARIRVSTDDPRGGNSQIQKEARSQARDLVKDAFSDHSKPEPKPEPKRAEPKRPEPKKFESKLSEPKKPEPKRTEPKISEPESVPVPNSPEAEQAIALGRQALQRIVDTISEGTNVAINQQNGRITYNVEGGNSALLIGKRGLTLEALQYLIEKIVNKQNDARIRVLVDVGGYLTARKTNLQRLATKMADKAQKTNKPVTIGQMNAYDRRIVHLHLKDKQGVRTQSVGEGYYRKLVIFPKRRRGKR